ncbi:MAG: CPBP family intramembrane metalloprotease [Nitrosopumilus sp.]|nr:CPBP family intramembrane metalloprotease [Nitrosopumilus sp.]
MVQIFSDLISAISQIIVFTLIPFIFYLFRKDKKISFSKYIGFTKPTRTSIVYSIGVALLILFIGIIGIFLSEGFKEAVHAPSSVTGKFMTMGLNPITFVSILIMALLKTSLSEEIFFRGFIGKQLINKLGFKRGNLLQGIIFGLVHFFLLLFLIKSSIFTLIIIFIFTSFAGWMIGYIKEKYANGSIIPGWIAHGIGNTISYLVIAFVAL